MPDLSHHARRLRDIADALETESRPNDAPFTPHSDTLKVINDRHTTRGQLNYSVPNALQLQQRVRRYHADHDIPHGDVVALALDTWLRARGYPPALAPRDRS